METICPFCHQKHSLSQADVRKQMRCPGCHHTFTANPLTGFGSAVKSPPLPPPMVGGSTAGGDPLDYLNAVPNPSSLPLIPPSSAGCASNPDETEIMLAGYRTQVKSRGEEEFIKRIASGADALKKRARALKLRHDVSSLWTAVNSQLENLGTLAITHRPPSVDMSSELSELSQVQRELAQRQVTADSLRQGAGGRSVVKQIEGEMARLRDRQREAIIAIGRKVAAARPDMPSAVGTYSALDRVQSALTTAEVALAELEREIGPTGFMGGLSFGEVGAIGKIVSLSAFMLAVLLFFFPWLTLSVHGKPDSMIGNMDIKILSQSGFQTSYAGVSSDFPDSGPNPAGLKDPAAALLMILYALVVAGGLAMSASAMLGKDTLRKWVILCSAAAFCLLTLQVLLGFPVETWLKGLPGQLAKAKDSMSFNQQMGMAMFVGAVESGVVIVRYTVFLWLSLLVALAPAIVAAGEELLLRGYLNNR